MIAIIIEVVLYQSCINKFYHNTSCIVSELHKQVYQVPYQPYTIIHTNHNTITNN